MPPEAFSVPPLGTVNVHPSLLPRHRGPNPLGWTLRGHEPEVGLTFHRMEADFDTGPVLAQGRRPLYDEDTVEAILQKVMALAGGLLPDVLGRVAWGEPGESQSSDQGSYAGLFEDAYREIDWTQPARAVHLQVRACRTAPCAPVTLCSRLHMGSGALRQAGGTPRFKFLISLGFPPGMVVVEGSTHHVLLVLPPGTPRRSALRRVRQLHVSAPSPGPGAGARPRPVPPRGVAALGLHLCPQGRSELPHPAL
ncbi:methionyl-tRNA formyltransferase [Archangium sp.]|uniref:methionyl-tRNA formyltransferase n=1 Tax=Archangium sp. TaxID=1872627 RepID=UPI0039C86860